MHDFEYESGRPREDLRWNMSAYAVFTDAALKHGWNPEGTKRPRNWSLRGWGEGYNSNDGQLITAADARNLALALLKAVHAGDLEPTPVRQKALESAIFFLQGSCRIF